MSTIDPAWTSIAIGVVSSMIATAVTGAISFAALKAWMARREQLEKDTERRLSNAEADIEVQSLGLQKLDVRVSVLEDRSPGRQGRQPRDYVPG